MNRAASKQRFPIWVLVVAVILIVIAAYLAGASRGDQQQIRTIAAPVPTTSPQLAAHMVKMETCQIREDLMHDEAGLLIKNFVRHGKAHKGMMHGMPLGDRDDPKPGTVRWEWKITLAWLWEHEPAYREAEKNYQEAKCGV